MDCFESVSTRTTQKVRVENLRVKYFECQDDRSWEISFSRDQDASIMIIRRTTSLIASLLAFPSVLPKIIQNPTLPLGIRTATKRAGGFKAGSSDSAGKRRGVKKGGGNLHHICIINNRRMGTSRKHNSTAEGNSMAPW
jgi:hypothetical protein